MFIDVTEEIRQYRECSRHTWNTYFYAIDNGVTLFENVDWALLDGLVLSTAQKDIIRPGRGEFIPELHVRFPASPSGFAVLVADQTEDRLRRWKQHTLFRDDTDLRFVEFFDFISADKPRDYQYVLVHVLRNAEMPSLEGLDLLLDPTLVSYSLQV